MPWKPVFGMRTDFCGVKTKFWFCGMEAKDFVAWEPNFVLWHGSRFLFVWRESQILWHRSQVFLKPSFVLLAWKPDFFIFGMKARFLFCWHGSQILVFGMKARFLA